MAVAEDPRLQDARRREVARVAEMLGVQGLSRVSGELVGPCPACGGVDRFGINVRKNVFNCRRCEAKGDAISLVRLVLGCDLAGALTWLEGGAAVEIDPEERARRDEAHARELARREAEAERRRGEAIASARALWRGGREAKGSPVADYLALRAMPASIVDAPPAVLRYAPDLAYVIQEGGKPETIHRGPAMLALIQGPNGGLIGVHRTWLDLSRPKGKADLGLDAAGRPRPAKKVWGSKRRGAIRLSHHRGEAFRALVMGEGIETTLPALAADAIPGAAYWAGIDLGHMGGARIMRGEGMKYAGVPDLDEHEAFLPPRGVEWLLFIQDGDSDPRLTRAKLLAGLRRARARVPTVTRASIVHPGEGRDLNDLLMDAGTAGARGTS
ncbi:DUF7146 domain-containing protein [Rubellimicrobium aerolatum]|uniref:DUF7146 domain-containing protein n=1 Tax=Rubellimicrobium aerolatum TaxID=490979 RepID=A0ABW0SEY9_9RHOB|nr:hypothetical protein [Rubellimicrobium aerolatum]MBP1806479.1 hypothetical protein [Rubellimicrobium aerolatum]